MILELYRKYKKNDYTIGLLNINGEFVCNTLEDTCRGLRQTDAEYILRQKKVYGKTAIPSGSYNVKITYSPKFKKNLPLIENVPMFSGVRIHSGNSAEDTLGCILCGLNKVKGKLVDSRIHTNIVIDRIRTALNKGELVTLKIYDN